MMFFAISSRTVLLAYSTLLWLAACASASAVNRKLNSSSISLGDDAGSGGGTGASDAGGGDGGGVVGEIISGQRKILLAGERSSQILLIVSGHGDDHAGSYVFLAEKNDEKSIKLSQPKKLSQKWPGLSTTGAMFLTGSTIITVGIQCSSFDINSLTSTSVVIGDLSLTDLTDPKITMALLSAGQSNTFYTIGGTSKAGVFRKLTYQGASGSSSTTYYFCSSGDNKVTVNKKACSSPVSWTIEAGYVGDANVVLFDKDNNVLLLPNSALTTDSGGSPQSADLTKISAKTFYVASKPSDTSEAADASTDVDATSVGHSKSTLIIIIVVVIVIVALVIGGVFFCLNRKSPLEATSKKRLDDASASAVKQSNIDGPPSMEKSNTLGNKSKSMSKAALTSHVASKQSIKGRSSTKKKKQQRSSRNTTKKRSSTKRGTSKRGGSSTKKSRKASRRSKK